MGKVRSLFTRRFTSLPARRRPVAPGSARPQLEELESRLVLSPVPMPDHVVVVIEENHAYSQIIGASTAPYINSLANQGALFTQSFAIGHPSQPNYLELFSGSNQGITSDTCVSRLLTTANLGSELIAAHDTFDGYSEGLPSAGSTVCTSGSYARKHNPWSDFSNVPTADNLPFTSFPSDYSRLPAVSIVVPNQANDMHDGTIQAGDTWLRNNLQAYVNWTATHNSLFILTFDEDNGGTNQIATFFVGPMVQQGRYSEHITHYNVLRTIEDMYGTGYAGQSGTATPITDVWATTQQVDHFAVTANANPAIAGTPFDVTVTAQDVNGNTVTGYTGTVTFSSGDPYGASLPANYTFQAADGGAHTFAGGAALYTAGIYDVTATDTVSGAAGAANVNVQAAPATMLYVYAPSSAGSGVAFDVTVYAVDPYYNTDTNYTGTVTWTSSDGATGVVLPADYAFQPSDQGVVTYSGGVTLITPGGQTITAADTVSGINGSATVTVTAGQSPGRGHDLAGLGLALAPSTAGRTVAPAMSSAPLRADATTSSLASRGVDRFFAVAGNDPAWVPFVHRPDAVHGFGLDAAPMALLLDLDALAV